ncbi:MAG TPA: substrate-binding domain-containing protein [Acidimicrobiales bacterium]
MPPIRARRPVWLPVVVVLGLALTACGRDSGGAAAGMSGAINISGSSTVEPISALAAEAFHDRDPSVDFAVDGPGTGDGFELFCDGEIDISDASRAIEDEEVATCERHGIEVVELRIGYDGIVVMTNRSNDAVECLNFADLYALIGPESDGVDRWSGATDIARNLGSDTPLPDAELVLTGPGTESGTYDSFVEIAIEGIAEERGLEPTTRTDYASSSDDNVIVATIEGSDTPLGWVGFAFAEEAPETVREIPIAAEPGGMCVEPTRETIADGSYPLSRPLFIYVNAGRAEQGSPLADFVDFYLANADRFVEEAGYVALPGDQAAETRAAWEAR